MILYLYSNSNVYIQLNYCESTVKSIYLYITIIVLLQYYCVILQRAVTVGTVGKEKLDRLGIEPRTPIKANGRSTTELPALQVCRRSVEPQIPT